MSLPYPALSGRHAHGSEASGIGDPLVSFLGSQGQVAADGCFVTSAAHLALWKMAGNEREGAAEERGRAEER